MMGHSFDESSLQKHISRMQSKEKGEELIYKYLSGNSTEEEKELLRIWIAENPDNTKTYQELKNIWQESKPVFDPSDIDTKAAEKKILKAISKPSWQHTFLIYWQRTAAILLLPLLICIAYMFIISGHNTASLLIAEQEIFAPFGTYSKINLPDGSTVWLNAGSTLKYPTIFGDKRKVNLKGEAFFEVESDKEHPFIVQTNSIDVVATGTAFNVEAYEKDTLTVVTMLHGKVAVEGLFPTALNILPGDQMRYNKQTLAYSVIKTDPLKWISWKDGIMMFRNDPLSEVFKRLSTLYNVDIVLKNPSIGNYKYRATFEGESLDEILSLLKLTAPIHYKKEIRKQNSNMEYPKQKIEVFKDGI